MPPDFAEDDGNVNIGLSKPTTQVDNSVKNEEKVLVPVFPDGRPRERWESELTNTSLRIRNFGHEDPIDNWGHGKRTYGMPISCSLCCGDQGVCGSV
ncbi:hypothetical protein F0562_019339 [Nyssa sinensis]|uniref:Uncharacterized protein n=1 Tax=Nyssa sinensis TaxID=561372 RepID=A0A5J4ZCK1_9ASTE|nr:hypothetical protein F0562_019339 [Nyssa sinensis]